MECVPVYSSGNEIISTTTILLDSQGKFLVIASLFMMEEHEVGLLQPIIQHVKSSSLTLT